MDNAALAASSPVLLPGWLVLLVALLVAIGVFLLVLRAQTLKMPLLILVLVGVLVIVYGLEQSHRHRAEREALQGVAATLAARASALDAALANSGLACLDAGSDMAEQCESVVFARPETVAEARTLIRARLALLADAAPYLQGAFPPQGSGSAPAAFASWRRALVEDPYGLVGVVLSEDFSCPQGDCAVAEVLGTRGPQTSATQRFTKLLAKHQELWQTPPAPKVSAPEPTPAAPVAPLASPAAAPEVDEPAGPPPVPGPTAPTPAETVPPAAANPEPAPSGIAPPAPEAAPAPVTQTPAPQEPPAEAVAEPAAPPVPTAVVPLPPPRPAIPRTPVRVAPAPQAPADPEAPPTGAQ